MGDEMEAPQNASIRQTKLSKTGTLIEQAKLSQLRWVMRWTLPETASMRQTGN